LCFDISIIEDPFSVRALLLGAPFTILISPTTPDLHETVDLGPTRAESAAN